MYPYNHKMGQRIQTDIPGVSVDRAFLAHYKIAAADAPAASSDGVLAATNLGVEAQSITTGITNPAVPRNIRIDGNVSGINGKVKIYGTNFSGKAITEEIQANGTTAKDGNLAFKTVIKVDLPVQNNTPKAQVETATAAGTVTTAGRAKCEITAAGMPGSPWHVPFNVELGDGANDIATALRAALIVDEIVPNYFDISGEDAVVVLTAKAPAANDDTLNISISDGEGEGASVGVTTAATSANTTAGVPYDQISVGWGDVFGLPYMLLFNTVVAAFLGGTADSLTVVTDADEIEKNTFDMTGSADGEKAIDVYLIV